MEQKKYSEEVAPVDDEEPEHIHLPPPSWAPIVLALGLACFVFGIVLSAVLLVIGVVLTLLGLGTWVYDEIRNASNADAQNEQGHTHTAA
jgi:Cytochrome c oxidase subunit IV